jgi:hypothetical protein
MVSEDDPWALAVAAPVAALLRQDGQTPLVIALTSPPTREAERLVTMARPRRAVVFESSKPLKLGIVLQDLNAEILPTGTGPGHDSLVVARRFWAHSRQAVAAAAEDAEAVVLGASLAAGLRVPLLVWDRAQPGAALSDALGGLQVEELLVAASDPQNAPAWSKGLAGKVQVHGPSELQRRIIAAIGREKVGNIVVARAPDGQSGAGRTAWLAPYVSAARGAAVVLTHSSAAAVADADVQQLIERHNLRPRNVTVLADYGSIGQNVVEIESEETRPPAKDEEEPAPAGKPVKVRYLVRTEPCVPRDPDKLAAFGVGRIPLESLADTSVLFARGLLRERLLAGQPPRLLMIANSGVPRRPLPLCEAISRATAEEFKNLGVAVDEFYCKPADSPEILAAAKNATMIYYEGHLGYQDLIEVPRPGHHNPPDTYFEEELDDVEGHATAATKPVAERPATPASRGPGLQGELDEAPPPRRSVVPGPTPPPTRLQGPLPGMPFVVLQSCESLEEPLLWRVDELGGVAVVGSVTPIHSGSGSTLLKAASDAMLYGGAGTLGEALRDAQNYLFCLEDLKTRRGHKEQAKGLRVALSFKLWGDPELRIFPSPLGPPQIPPVVAQWDAPGQLTIRLPKQRLPEVRSDKYVAHAFPGTQAAGMVKQRNGDTTKQITPVYYFRVPLPNDFAAGTAAAIQTGKEDANRMIARVDPAGRTLHVVYLPEQEKAGESIVLRLKSRANEPSMPERESRGGARGGSGDPRPTGSRSTGKLGRTAS